MSTENHLTIRDVLIRLKDDFLEEIVKLTNNKLNKNLGTTNSGKVLAVNSDGDVTTKELYAYGPEDIGVGAPLETGKLYFVYEE